MCALVSALDRGDMRPSVRSGSKERAPVDGDVAPAYDRRVKKTILVYGLLGGLLIALLKLVEYRFLVIEHSLEIYGGIVAALFSILGLWLRLQPTPTRGT